MKAKKFDQLFDRGEDVSAALDLEKATRGTSKLETVNIELPAWMVESIDREANRLAVTRESIIKVWLAECLTRTEQSGPAS